LFYLVYLTPCLHVFTSPQKQPFNLYIYILSDIVSVCVHFSSDTGPQFCGIKGALHTDTGVMLLPGALALERPFDLYPLPHFQLPHALTFTPPPLAVVDLSFHAPEPERAPTAAAAAAAAAAAGGAAVLHALVDGQQSQQTVPAPARVNVQSSNGDALNDIRSLVMQLSERLEWMPVMVQVPRKT
jgi:hypothetical protein